jgi:hypothetical protein
VIILHLSHVGNVIADFQQQMKIGKLLLCRCGLPRTN